MTGRPDKADLEKRMDGAHRRPEARSFGGLRTGRASASLLDPVMVEAYGQRMPLNQVGTVSAPEPRMLTVQVWDKRPGQSRSTRRSATPASASTRRPTASSSACRFPS